MSRGDQVSVFDVKIIYMISNFVNLKPPIKMHFINLIFILFLPEHEIIILSLCQS